MRSTFREVFSIFLSVFSVVSGALHRHPAAGGPCSSTDLQRAQFTLAGILPNSVPNWKDFSYLPKSFCGIYTVSFSRKPGFNLQTYTFYALKAEVCLRERERERDTSYKRSKQISKEPVVMLHT